MERELIRLNRLLASRGICSRRKADELIKSGKVKVNGEIISSLGYQANPEAQIEVEGYGSAREQRTVYLMMNKPPRVICSMHDPQGRETVLDLLPARYRRFRPFPCGRLDYFSEGLLIITNDGKFAEELAHPRHEKTKEYEVLVRGSVSEAVLKDMREGMLLQDGVKCLPAKVESSMRGKDTLLRIEIKQGLNRQIRKMCEKWQLVILRLKRVRIGKYALGDLKQGEVREFKPERRQTEAN